jgi:hypothetical protein
MFIISDEGVWVTNILMTFVEVAGNTTKSYTKESVAQVAV